MVKSIRLMVEGNVDLYKVLQVQPEATPQEIKQAYRKQALLYHPDKQPKKERNQVADHFSLILTSYQILSDPQLRQQYEDLVCSHNKHPSKPVTKIAGVRDLQRKLREKEIVAQQASNSGDEIRVEEIKKHLNWVNIEQLREEGIKKRRVLEEETIENADQASNSIYDLPVKEMLQVNTERVFAARLKFKQRPEVRLDKSVISQIMSIFGKVQNVELLEINDDKYGYAEVEFNDSDALDAATEYDYSTAQRWDGTSTRKLASLLRSCTKAYGPDGDTWTNNPTVNAVLDQYVQSVSDRNGVGATASPSVQSFRRL
ncbi:hypothetical protein KGF57_004033 [Candida theae]|uniref:J domain-containing protein n=1 Tax=Candida theae TaxID=1198502 RepID=A0AAD5BCR1_9ASCO|nr:uncharacterized protein KGF57_004033 [Candida theae]KAI5953041.1 hypothetical protein KGF57_004033 [Candida theae]